MIKNVLKKVLATSIATAMLLPSITGISNVTAFAATTDFGTGKGVSWPAQVNAPYVDMVEWITKAGYNYGGVANLTKLSQDTGVKYFNLGFIQATSGVSNGKVNWGWGGYSVLSEGSSDTQYLGLKQSIKDFRATGGDVTISFGGLTGTALWEASSDVNALAASYTEIVNGYGLTRLDLDIEGGAQNKAANVTNAKAIKKVQDATKVDVVLTLPVLPSGLTSEGLGALEAYLANGVNVKAVNIMTMCYGDGVLLPGENYGTASVRAIDSTKDQLKSYFKTYAGVTLSDSEAYAKLGTTCSVGYESSSFPIFTPALAKVVVDSAIKNKIAMTSYWSLNRDAQLDTNQGITGAYLFNDVYKQFGTINPNPTNTAPVLNGVKNSTIAVGSTFNALAGVTATDKEDGDLTNKIVVTGSVNTQVAGNYTLTYSVSDSKGLVTTATATVTVQGTTPPVNTAPVINGVKNSTITVGDTFNALTGITAADKEDGDLTSKIVLSGSVNNQIEGNYTLTYKVTDSKGLTTTATAVVTVQKRVNPLDDTYDANKIYNTGDVVVYNNVKYKANWWTKGENPSTSAAWTKVVTANTDGSVDYVAGTAYSSGALVKYNNIVYKANWWTNTTPGSDSSWSKK